MGRGFTHIPDDFPARAAAAAVGHGGRNANGHVPGIPQLIGNLGRAVEITEIVSPALAFTSLGRVSFEDGEARDIDIVFSLPPIPTPAFGVRLFGLVSFGSGGLQPSTAKIDLGKGSVVSVCGSYAEVSVCLQCSLPSAPLRTMLIGAFASFGTRVHNDPRTYIDASFLGIAGGAAAIQDVNTIDWNYVKEVCLLTNNADLDTYRMEFMDGPAVVVYDWVKYTGQSPDTARAPLMSGISQIRVTNLDPVRAIGGRPRWLGRLGL